MIARKPGNDNGKWSSTDYTSGDENHLCGASLRESHKISLKAHRHGVRAPIAKPEKLPVSQIVT